PKRQKRSTPCCLLGIPAAGFGRLFPDRIRLDARCFLPAPSFRDKANISTDWSRTVRPRSKGSEPCWAAVARKPCCRSWWASAGLLEAVGVKLRKSTHAPDHLTENDAGQHQGQHKDDLVIARQGHVRLFPSGDRAPAGEAEQEQVAGHGAGCGEPDEPK